jgi:hypothetical protein
LSLSKKKKKKKNKGIWWPPATHTDVQLGGRLWKCPSPSPYRDHSTVAQLVEGHWLCVKVITRLLGACWAMETERHKLNLGNVLSKGVGHKKGAQDLPQQSSMGRATQGELGITAQQLLNGWPGPPAWGFKPTCKCPWEPWAIFC